MSAHHHLSTLALTAGHDLSKHGKTIAVPITNLLPTALIRPITRRRCLTSVSRETFTRG